MVVKAQKIGREIWGRDVGSETAVESSKNFLMRFPVAGVPYLNPEEKSANV